jgi:hypothetical protein
MPKGSSKSTAVIERLLEERRQYEAWIVRLSAGEDATPAHVRERVQADYEARLEAVLEELKSHAESARQMIEQKQHLRLEVKKKERLAAEKLAETELRHAVGEYDEAAWGQVHQDAMAELVKLREELQALEADIQKLQELDTLVRAGPKAPSLGGTAPPAQPRSGRTAEPLDELAFIKSVTDEKTGNAPSPKRTSGAQYQQNVPVQPPTAPRPPRRSQPRSDPIGDEDGGAIRGPKVQGLRTLNLPRVVLRAVRRAGGGVTVTWAGPRSPSPRVDLHAVVGVNELAPPGRGAGPPGPRGRGVWPDARFSERWPRLRALWEWD